MDRRIATRDQLPTEAEFMEAQRFAYQGLGAAMLDILGLPTTAWAFGFACVPTSPASLSFKVGPGRLYSLQHIDATAQGQKLGTGGLAADVNPDHDILRQALYRDTVTLGPLAAPGTAGQSQSFLVQGRFTTADDTPVTTQFYNTAAPDTPITDTVSLYRRDTAEVAIKNGTAAATGSQTIPAADSGWVPLWVITLAYGDTSITSGKIAKAPGAPFVTVGSPVPVVEVTASIAPVAGVLTIPFGVGNYFVCPMTANITSVVFTGQPAAGFAQEVTVEFIGDGTTRTVTGLGGANLKWAGSGAAGSQPTFVFTANYKNKVILTCRDGGANADANYAGTTAP